LRRRKKTGPFQRVPVMSRILGSVGSCGCLDIPTRRSRSASTARPRPRRVTEYFERRADAARCLNAPTGPSSFRISNKGGIGQFTLKSNGVSVPIGAQIMISNVMQNGQTITVDGAGFSTLTVINLFNAQNGGVINLGGIGGEVERRSGSVTTSTPIIIHKRNPWPSPIRHAGACFQRESPFTAGSRNAWRSGSPKGVGRSK
jgi:hypothetical protein